MKKKILSALAIIVALANTSGCSLVGLNSGDLMHPPKTSVDEQNIMELIEKTSGNNYTLKYPENGANRSAIIMNDINGDSKQEALAFYQTSTLSESTIHMLVMYEDKNGWNTAGDFQTQNAGIDRVEFADITGDGVLEIITGYKTYTSNTNQLNIFTYNGKEATQLETVFSYTNLVIDKFSSADKAEILTLSLQPDNASNASLLGYNDSIKTVSNISSVAIDPGITSFEYITSGMLDKNTTCAVVDGTFSTDKLCTQIIYYDSANKKLVNGLYKEKATSANPTIRDAKTYCTDIDKNQTSEIPILTKMPCGKNENIDSVASNVTWNSYDINKNTLIPQATMIVNYSSSYYFKLDDNNLNKVTARINLTDNSMTIYGWNGTEITDELLTIKVYSSQDYSTAGKNDGFSLIKESGAKAYCYKIANVSTDLKYTDEQVVKAFSLFTDYEQN